MPWSSADITTILENCEEQGDIDVVRSLINKNGDITTDIHDEDGYTPLHRAAYSNKSKVIALLLGHGGDPGARTHSGWTPLHSAAHWGCYRALGTLLRLAVVDIDAITDSGQTALHLAASQDHPQAVATLLSYGANTTIVNNLGHTAETLTHHPAISLMIRNYQRLYPTTTTATTTTTTTVPTDVHCAWCWAGQPEDSLAAAVTAGPDPSPARDGTALFKRCTRCKATRYCSVTCQKNHWAVRHQYECTLSSSGPNASTTTTTTTTTAAAAADGDGSV